MKETNSGIFVVSLDFELFWGMADIANIDEWQEKIKMVYNIVPRTLELFKKYAIHATWATVGGIMLENEQELYKYLPINLPKQTKSILNKFSFNDKEKCIPQYMLFGNELVKQINETVGQEIGTHTFTHYYCDDIGSNPTEFSTELQIASLIMKNKGYGICKSVVFPRNQVQDKFVSAIPNNIKTYRGGIPGYIGKIKKMCNRIGTLIWYIDHYLPLQDSTYFKDTIKEGKLCNIKLSRLFKAWKNEYRFAEKLKIWRYKFEMTRAAKKGKVYHICWHPHNFSTFTEKNFEQLEELLSWQKKLEKKYGMRSMNMLECAKYIMNT